MDSSMNWLWVLLGLIVIGAVLVGLKLLANKGWSFGKCVLVALFSGLVLGVIAQLIFPLTSKTIGGVTTWYQNAVVGGMTLPNGSVVLGNSINSWLTVLSTAYKNMLQLMIVPLVAVSIISGLMKAGETKDGGKSVGAAAGVSIATLLITCGIAAVISIAVTSIFGLDASNGFGLGKPPVGDGGTSSPSFQTTLNGFFEGTNILGILSANKVLSVIFIAVVLGIVFNNVRKESPETGVKVSAGVDLMMELVFGLVEIVIGLAPYAVVIFMFQFAATTAFGSYIQLGLFVIASYVAMIIMFALHFVIVFFCGVTPLAFIKKASKAWILGFVTRSSSATLPVTIECMNEIGVEGATANFAGTFGTCIGQNGCAGVYPAILATMIYTAQGINLFTDPVALISLVFLIVVSSLGIAGVGGGATAAGLMVFGALGGAFGDAKYGIALIGLLFAVEPLIDMGRTMLNVSDSVVAGIVASRVCGTLNLKKDSAKA